MENIKGILEEKDRYLSRPVNKKRTTWTPNDILIYENHAEVILRNNKKEINGICLIDKKDIDEVKKHKWSLSSGYARTSRSEKTVRMHTLLLNPPKGMQIDHINHNGLDNRRDNLRIVTFKENMKNCSKKQIPRLFKIK